MDSQSTYSIVSSMSNGVYFYFMSPMVKKARWISRNPKAGLSGSSQQRSSKFRPSWFSVMITINLSLSMVPKYIHLPTCHKMFPSLDDMENNKSSTNCKQNSSQLPSSSSSIEPSKRLWNLMTAINRLRAASLKTTSFTDTSNFLQLCHMPKPSLPHNSTSPSIVRICSLLWTAFWSGKTG